jgi:hypothetical protein
MPSIAPPMGARRQEGPPMKIHPQATTAIIPFTARIDNYRVSMHRGVNPLAEAICDIPRSWRIADTIIGPSMQDYLTGDTIVKGKLVCWRWFKEAK